MSRPSLVAVLVLLSASAQAAVPVGSTVEPFTLRDSRGTEHRLPDRAERPVVVLAVLGAECPLANLYCGRLEELSKRFADRDVAFFGVNANAQDSITEIAAQAKRQGVTFPILKDVGNAVVDAVGATRTPEVVVLDRDRVIRYRGRIDDQYGIGHGRDEPTETYLVDAIEAVLAGRPVAKAEVEPVGCLIGRTREPKADAEVGYADAAAVLNRRCVECHRTGEVAPFALTNYESAAGWAETIAEVVREDRMPPWHAAEPTAGSASHDGARLEFAHGVAYANDRRLSPAEKDVLVRWAAAGAPKGEAAPPAAPAKPVAGWRLPREPDAVIPMAEKPFQVPAEGTVRYQHFRAKTGFDEERWIKAAEIVPGNRAAVHHVLVFARAKGSDGGLGEGGSGFLAAYVPGLEAAVYPAGMAKPVPAGAELIFQVHYTPTGTPQEDLTKIGLVFADADEVDHVVETRNAIGRRLLLKPNEADQRFESEDVIPYDSARLLALMPHMHLRGQAFRYRLGRDDERPVLLDVPRYDFNWQTGYALAEPMPLERGDRILCEAWFDNSAANPANPDPNATVKWGEQTWDEMMIGYYDVAVPRDEWEAGPGLAARVKNGLRGAVDRLAGRGDRPSAAEVDAKVREAMDRHDTDGDGAVTVDELPERLKPLHGRLDRDGDGRVVPQEMRLLFGRATE